MSSMENTVNVPGSETIEQVGGSSPVSFDEIEAVTAYRDQKEKSETKEIKTVAKAAAKEAVKTIKKEASSEAGKSEGDSVEGKDERTLASDDSKSKAADKTDIAKPDEAPVKTFKVKSGDDELELRADAKIPVKVAGEEKEVTLDDLRRDFSGRVDWSRKYSELDKERKQFVSDKTFMTSKLKEALDLSKQDGLSALLKFAELTGYDPIKYRQEFMASMIPAVEKYAQLEEHEKRALDREFELNFKQQALDAREAQDRQARELEQFTTQVTQTLKGVGLTEDEFFNAYASLARMSESGQLKRAPDLDFTLQIAIADKTFDLVEAAVEEAKAELEPAKRDKLATALANAVKSKELSFADVKETALMFLKTERAENLSAKVRKSAPEKVKQIETSRAPKNPASEPISFDDL